MEELRADLPRFVGVPCIAKASSKNYVEIVSRKALAAGGSKTCGSRNHGLDLGRVLSEMFHRNGSGVRGVRAIRIPIDDAETIRARVGSRRLATTRDCPTSVGE